MDAGEYRERIIIEKCDYTEDDVGNQLPEWNTYFRCRAKVNNLFGSEYWEAARVNSQDTVVFETRYHPLLKNVAALGYRLVHQGIVYNITFVDNVKYRNETIKIRAKTEGADDG